MDDKLDFRPWYADGFVYCPVCRTPLRHNENFAINGAPGQATPAYRNVPVSPQTNVTQSVTPQTQQTNVVQESTMQTPVVEQPNTQQLEPMPQSEVVDEPRIESAQAICVEEKSAFCSNCGRAFREGDNFCPACGTKR